VGGGGLGGDKGVPRMKGFGLKKLSLLVLIY
jgi:hypothetical protein